MSDASSSLSSVVTYGYSVGLLNPQAATGIVTSAGATVACMEMLKCLEAEMAEKEAAPVKSHDFGSRRKYFTHPSSLKDFESHIR